MLKAFNDEGWGAFKIKGGLFSYSEKYGRGTQLITVKQLFSCFAEIFFSFIRKNI